MIFKIAFWNYWALRTVFGPQREPQNWCKITFWAQIRPPKAPDFRFAFETPFEAPAKPPYAGNAIKTNGFLMIFRGPVANTHRFRDQKALPKRCFLLVFGSLFSIPFYYFLQLQFY